MNLIVRLMLVVIASLFKSRLPVGQTECHLTLITLPNDLDINLHMNNGRYLTICDLTRVDLFIRTGLLKTIRRRGWIPIVAEHTMTYKKPLKLFSRFRVSLYLTHWDEKYFYMTHTFTDGDRSIAEGSSKGVIKSKSGVVKPCDVIEAVIRDRGV